ncbi:MAG: hypothetical protein NZO58_00960 [Gemmataceae bacterium]|nr:hypothetical protein [Gemmataceae bacterium]
MRAARNTPMRLGDPAPQLTLFRPDGTAVSLADFLGKPLWLVFLRHLA